MKKASRLPKKLIRSIIIPYLACTITLTLIHLTVDFYRTKNNILNQVQVVGMSMMEGITQGIWNYDLVILSKIATGALDFPYIVGIRILDMDGMVMVEQFDRHYRYTKNSTSNTSSGLDFSIILNNNYDAKGKPIYIGQTEFLSDNSILFDELKTDYLMILVFSLLKSIILISLIYFVAQKWVRTPLRLLQNSVRSIDPDKIDEASMADLQVNVEEFNMIHSSFNNLVTQLQIQKVNQQETYQELLNSNRRLSFLVDSSKDLFIVNDKFTAMEKVINKILTQLQPSESTLIKFSYLEDEKNQNSRSFSHVEAKVVKLENGKWAMDTSRIASLKFSYSNSILNAENLDLNLLDSQEISQRGDRVFMPIHNNKQLIAMIMLKGYGAKLSQIDTQFLSTLLQLLAITLEDIKLNFHLQNAKEDLKLINEKLEMKVVERTQDLENSLKQIQRFQHALNVSPHAVMITDSMGNIEYVNHKFTEVNGYSLQEIRGKNARILRSGHTPRETYEQFWNTILSGREWRGKFYNKSKHGKYFWESVAVSSLKDDKNQIQSFISVRDDITASEELLLQQENYMKEVEYQNLVLNSTKSKLIQTIEEKRSVLERLSRMYHTHIQTLQNLNQNLMNSPVIETRDPLRNSSRLLFELEEIIKPLAYEYDTETRISEKTVLLLDDNKKRQILVKTALGGTGMNLLIGTSTRDTEALLQDDQIDILCLSSQFVEIIQNSEHLKPHVKVVLLTDDHTSESLRLARGNQRLSNIITTSMDDRVFALKNILVTVKKIVNQDYFGLEKYLNWGAEVTELPVSSSSDRIDLIQKLESYLQQTGVRKRVLSRATAIAEELLMNAIYDAPVDEQGHHIYNNLPRTEKVILTRDQQGIFKFGTDGVLLAVSVEDPFGSLTKHTVLNYLIKRFDNEEIEEHLNKKGAGLGLFQTLQSTDLLVINSKPHVKTEVIAIFNLGPVNAQNSQASFHYFMS